MKTEPGVVTAHPIIYAAKMLQTIFRTWMFCRKRGWPCNKWYGVYEAGTENLLAGMGPGPGSEARAYKVAKALSEQPAQPGKEE